MRSLRCACLAFTVIAAAASAAPPARETWSVKGLSQPAELVIDKAGLAHLYAANIPDAYFLQGYNVARDRLWQIDLWRKRGMGLLSASFGPAFVRKDRAARLFLYRGDLTAEWSRYAPGTQENFEAFARGVNAYVDEAIAGNKPMPLEFIRTGSRPDHWQAEDLVRMRSVTFIGNVESEVDRAQVACVGNLEVDRIRAPLYPDHKPKIPEGLNPCDIPADLMIDYGLGTLAPRFTPDTMATSRSETLGGSNNWVIGPSRSTTGHPILANDPHRIYTVPSFRYVVHMEAPGLSVVGASEPGMPGVSFGHNGNAAFGLTIFVIDQEDLYVYTLKPGDPDSYRYGNGWEKMRVVRETIPVKGGKPMTAELRFTRHGPVIRSDAIKGRAFAIRSVWWTAGTGSYLGATWLANAKNWNDFADAAHHWDAPGSNLIWADKSGTIGWIPAGRAPNRPNWDGLLPVPGDGRYEWQGFHLPENMPHSKNPAAGWIATANEFNIPSESLKKTPIVGYESQPRSRKDRIDEVILSKSKFSVADSVALQLDTHSKPARDFIAIIRDLDAPRAEQREAIDLVRNWDGNTTGDSVATTIFEMWTTQHLSRTLARRISTPEAAAIVEQGVASSVASVHLLQTLDPILGAEPQRVRREILLESLDLALTDLRRRLGPDMKSWRWDRLHVLHLAPAVAPWLNEKERRAAEVGPIGLPGSTSTTGLQGYRGKDFSVWGGASVRFVMDVGDWDKSLFVNMPGQSGDPSNPHYRDMIPSWMNGDYRPLAFTREAVDREAERIIKLTPSR